MILFLILLSSLASCAGGIAIGRSLFRKDSRYPEPPILDTPDHVLNYLEACSIDRGNHKINKLLDGFRSFIGQKQLLGQSITQNKPQWYHSTVVAAPPEEQETFFT